MTSETLALLRPQPRLRLRKDSHALDVSQSLPLGAVPSDLELDDHDELGIVFSVGTHRVKVAPYNTPLFRRRQTLAVLWHTVLIPVCTAVFLYMVAFPVLWPVLFVYFCYYVYDYAPTTGGVVHRRLEWLRRQKFWVWFNNYFPIEIHKTVDLQPTFSEELVTDKREHSWWRRLVRGAVQPPHRELVKTGPRYIFGYHPHGVIGMGVFGAVGTDGAGWLRVFPGIPTLLLTLTNNFGIPIYREYLMAMGLGAVNRKNVLRTIRETNNLVCIVVGGAQELLLALPNSTELVLEKRKGFVKLALELGDVCLVPVYGFGENEVYLVLHPEKELAIRKVQTWIKKRFQFTVPLFYARGVFNYLFGLMPYRRRIDVVFGNPIAVPFRPLPTREEVEHYHRLYVDEVKRLFDANKGKYGNPESELRIVE